ncbi:MAG: hypothetical protein HC933_07050 [Pleurocapsa sp. SU_196_0]|nr:hypothetical protein [Pleurocapsa sp. SU_196_0]
MNALTDARLALADLEGDGDGEVVALVAPTKDRYAHGVLGDAVEATAVVVLERHSLAVRWRLDLPSPFVFEDLSLRPVRFGGQDRLAVVRSSAKGGAALALVGLSANRLEVTAAEDFGQPNRWLNPLVGFGTLYAVHTPHIGGVLNQYSLVGNKLSRAARLEGVSSHRIGSRHLESALVVAVNRLVVPRQDHRGLVAITCTQGRCVVTSEVAFGAAYSSNMIRFGAGLAMAAEDRKLYFWTP